MAYWFCRFSFLGFFELVCFSDHQIVLDEHTIDHDKKRYLEKMLHTAPRSTSVVSVVTKLQFKYFFVFNHTAFKSSQDNNSMVLNVLNLSDQRVWTAICYGYKIRHNINVPPSQSTARIFKSTSLLRRLSSFFSRNRSIALALSTADSNVACCKQKHPITNKYTGSDAF